MNIGMLFNNYVISLLGQVIEFDNRVKRVANNLKFVAVELSDSGNYQCVAGQKVATLKLNVIGRYLITGPCHYVKRPI